MEKKTDFTVSPYTPIEHPSQMLRDKLQKQLETEHGILPGPAGKENKDSDNITTITMKLEEKKCEEKPKIFRPPRYPIGSVGNTK
jgi:hypothetical protein